MSSTTGSLPERTIHLIAFCRMGIMLPMPVAMFASMEIPAHASFLPDFFIRMPFTVLGSCSSRQRFSSSPVAA